MTTWFCILAFVFGTAIGSFLNVLIFRYAPEGRLFDLKRLGGRSHCPYCGHELGALELVPVLSFLLQGGQCRQCGHRLSFQYPIVELLSGAIFAGVPLFLNSFYGKSNALFASGALPVWYYLLIAVYVLAFLIWLTIAAIDLRHYVIPNALNLGLLLCGAAATYLVARYETLLFPFRESFLKQYTLIFAPFQSVFLNHLIGLLFGLAFFWLLVIMSRGRGMGLGDVKLAAAAGLLLGWPDIVLATMVSFVLGGLLGVGLMLARRKTMRDRIPFAPLLVLGFALTTFFGAVIVSGYFRLFSL